MVEWYCCPRFDSLSVFAAILDADRGGPFRISPDCDGWRSKQLYLPDPNILITRLLTPGGVGEVQDFMAPATDVTANRHRIIRRVVAVRGHIDFVVDVAPRFDYARAGHEVEITEHGALFSSSACRLSLSTGCSMEVVDRRGAPPTTWIGNWGSEELAGSPESLCWGDQSPHYAGTVDPWWHAGVASSAKCDRWWRPYVWPS